MIDVIDKLRVAAEHADAPLFATWKSWTTQLKGRCPSRRVTGDLKTYLTKCLFEKPLNITFDLYSQPQLSDLIRDDFFRLASKAGYFIVGDRDGDYVCVSLEDGSVSLIPGWSITEGVFERERRYKSLRTFLSREIKRARDAQARQRESEGLRREFVEASKSDPNAADERGFTLYHRGLMAGDFDAVRDELHRGARHDTLTRNGRNPLAMAIATGDLRIIRLLLERGCDPNAFTEQYGLACIHIAAIRSPLEVIQLLHEFDADLALESEREETPLSRAISNRERADVVRYMLEQGVDATAHLELAVSMRQYVGLLLEFGADPNVNEGAALRNALFDRQADIVEQLLAAGASLDAIADVITSVDLAPDMKRCLRAAGAEGLK